MATVLRLEPGPIADPALLTLRGGDVYLFEANGLVEGRLTKAGVSFELLSGSTLPDGALLVFAASPLEELVWVVDRLLGPGGCPWDQAQTHQSLKRYMLEEAYEVFDAIDRQDDSALCEELGDLLLQPVLHGQIASARGSFDTYAAANAIVEKLIRRHPHVFGDVTVADADEVLRNWDQIKKTEKGEGPRSVLAGVPKGMASLIRAYEVSKRAARSGFEWPNIEAVFEKLREEELELREALADGSAAEIESELGDLLFTVVNIGLCAGIEPEEALRKMVDRFTRRFMWVERESPKELNELTSDEWEELWAQAKSKERG